MRQSPEALEAVSLTFGFGTPLLLSGPFHRSGLLHGTAHPRFGGLRQPGQSFSLFPRRGHKRIGLLAEHPADVADLRLQGGYHVLVNVLDGRLQRRLARGDVALLTIPHGRVHRVGPYALLSPATQVLGGQYLLQGQVFGVGLVHHRPDIVSNVCGIPFERLRGEISEAKLTPTELERYHKLMSALGPHLHFANWGKDRSRSIRGDLRTEIERFSALRGGIDVLIFDWIGAARRNATGGRRRATRANDNS